MKKGRKFGFKCSEKERNRMKKQMTKHGMYYTRFYRIWRKMHDRCSKNKNYDKYKYYRAKGIIICEKWLDFVNFKNDMYKSYLEHCKLFGEKNTTIDRINGNENYCKENCRWATYIVQNNNRNWACK